MQKEARNFIEKAHDGDGLLNVQYCSVLDIVYWVLYDGCDMPLINLVPA